MKQSSTSSVTKKVSFYTGEEVIQIAGQELRPDEDVAFVEFYLSHAFPVTTVYRTGIHPQVVANSYRSLRHKVFNLAHLMKSYDPENNPRDRMLGTILEVEFPEKPEGGWKAQSEKSLAPGIRAVAVMHKAAEMVNSIVKSWEDGKAPFDGEWSVSMENESDIPDGGFLVRGTVGVESFSESTPQDLKDLGFIYVPALSAPTRLLECLNTEEDDETDGVTSLRIKRNFRDQETLFLLGGIAGKIRYTGTGLTPVNPAEKEARVARMLASEGAIDGALVTAPLHELADKVKNIFGT